MSPLRAAILTLSLLALPAVAHGPAQKEQGKAAADCHHPAEAPAAHASPKKGDEQGWVLTRGAPLAGAPAVELAELLKAPEAHVGKTVRVQGMVRKACEKKGCWMELAPDPKGAGVRVTFKDYGFFVPLDSAGARARVEGVVKVSELSEGHAAHYEAEGGIVPRGKDGKPREVQLVASGVELRR